MRPIPTITCAAALALASCGRGEGTPNKAGTAASDAAGAATPLARCGVDGPGVLSGDGIAALRLGATVEQVTLACRVLADTTDPRGPEGAPERSLLVLAGDRPDTLRAVVVGDSIWRVHVTGAWPRTADSLGVGSTVGQLRGRREAKLIKGEGRLFITTADPCGLSFRLARPDDGPGLSLGALPDSLSVAEVLVVGCR